MSRLWEKFWLRTKIAIIAVVLLYVVIFVLKNRGNQAKIWFSFDGEYQTTTLMLTLVAFTCGVVSTLIAKVTLSTARQYREMTERNRRERQAREIEELRAKAEMLQPRPAALPEPITVVASEPSTPVGSDGAPSSNQR